MNSAKIVFGVAFLATLIPTAAADGVCPDYNANALVNACVEANVDPNLGLGPWDPEVCVVGNIGCVPELVWPWGFLFGDTISLGSNNYVEATGVCRFTNQDTGPGGPCYVG